MVGTTNWTDEWNKSSDFSETKRVNDFPNLSSLSPSFFPSTNETYDLLPSPPLKRPKSRPGLLFPRPDLFPLPLSRTQLYILFPSLCSLQAVHYPLSYTPYLVLFCLSRYLIPLYSNLGSFPEGKTRKTKVTNLFLNLFSVVHLLSLSGRRSIVSHYFQEGGG